MTGYAFGGGARNGHDTNYFEEASDNAADYRLYHE